MSEQKIYKKIFLRETITKYIENNQFIDVKCIIAKKKNINGHKSLSISLSLESFPNGMM